ncbi:MAG: transport system ATP-binding/permease protein [Thermoanaerobaculia bacterium]|jgi:pSer/pThr/pTyr-binding forkhead associated (FHA) protein|nr:transport system ATP-binding/permease protein [Thermoanaerobaculia bacterium]
MALRYHPRMPLIRCAKCGQAYDVPGVIAVRLPNSIATCDCGEWISGSKAAVLARLMNPEEIREIDLKPYRVRRTEDAPSAPIAAARPAGQPRSVRVIARGAKESVNTVFTIGAHPLWIGRKGCHVELGEPDLSLRHCSISLQGDDLVARDADSHMGTFLDGQKITEAVIGEGTHLLRVGSALVSVEPTEEPGVAVEPVRLEVEAPLEEAELVHRITQRGAAVTPPSPTTRPVLICIGGTLNGQEFEIPPSGLVVGREGHVRVPDEFLSRRHFEVGPDPDGTIRVRDLGSRNGTFLNTLPAHNTKVQSGDEIRAGINRFRIEQR